MNTHIKNFSLLEEKNTYISDDLIFTTKANKKKDILGTTFAEKVNHVHNRQNLFIRNAKLIYGLSKKVRFVKSLDRVKDLNKVISKLIDTNKLLSIEISKFRTAAKLENQSEIPDSDNYKEFTRMKERPEGNKEILEKIYFELMNQILLENPEFFSRFTGQAYLQATKESFIEFITPILEHHKIEVEKVN